VLPTDPAVRAAGVGRDPDFLAALPDEPLAADPEE
jgi:hypothetical protein